MDNPGGHGGGRGDMTKTTIARLNAWAQQLPAVLQRLCGPQLSGIVFVAQQPRSPDTNALDLGIWVSLQVAVEKEKARMPTSKHAPRRKWHHPRLQASVGELGPSRRKA